MDRFNKCPKDRISFQTQKDIDEFLLKKFLVIKIHVLLKFVKEQYTFKSFQLQEENNN